MKKALAFFGCLAFSFSLAFSSGEEAYSYSYARLSYVKGDVFLQRTGDLGYEEGVVNLAVVEGDKLGTREGRAEVHFGRRNYLRIDSHSQLDFVELPVRGDDSVMLNLLSGSLFLRIRFLEKEKSFEIHTPDVSFYILEEGLYRVDVRENRETELFVYEGTMEAAGEEGSLLVESEERLTVSNGYFTSAPASFYPRFDDSFARWSKERDALHARPAAAHYLPEELSEYEGELAANGHWVYERPYGYVWIPYVVHVDWRPYWYGRWVWYPIIGWTWVSYDPWGWVVSRYGRWHWTLGLGWYWIPTRIWGPAWVHWYSGFDYIGWCPLSYWGYPALIIDNYFYGRYTDRYYPAHSRALVVVHKNQLQNPHLSRLALSQEKVSRLEKISLSERQPDRAVSIGRIEASKLTAVRALSRFHLRDIRKNYVPDRTLSLSSLRSGLSRQASGAVYRNDAANARPGTLRDPGPVSRPEAAAPDVKRSLSASGLIKPEASQRISSRPSRSEGTDPGIQIYPSRHIRPSTRTETHSLSKSRLSSRTEAQSLATGTQVQRRLSPEREVRTYSPRMQTFPPRNAVSPPPTNSRSSLSRSQSGSFRHSVERPSISRNTPGQALSSSPSRISSRPSSAVRSGISSSRTPSSTGAKTSSSSVRSSSGQGSASGGRVKKK